MNQKLEDSLELALQSTEAERSKTNDLNIGYNESDNTWELIVKYSGDLKRIQDDSIRVELLYGGYAIVRLPENRIREVSSLPEVEYIEKPKQLYFQTYEGRYASCIPPVQNPPFSLTGRGTIIASVDSGIDYAHPDFRNEDGTTRILYLWDQGVPEGVYTANQINEALAMPTSQERFSIVPSADASGHGTAVMGIAAGNGRSGGSQYLGVASESELIVVKMGAPGFQDFPRTTQLMRGVDFCVKKAIELAKPLALNISFGNNYGSHDGKSLLETYLDTVASIGRTTIVVATGNEGERRRHASGVVKSNQNRQIELAVAEGERNLNLQIWKRYVDEYEIRLVSPSGKSLIISESAGGVYRANLDNNAVLWIFGEPSPYNRDQEIYLELIPYGIRTNLQSGIWKIILSPTRIVQGDYEMWLPAGTEIGDETGFLIPSPDITLTIPSTASKVISVGAYNSKTESVAAFSGRGPDADGMQKPDLVAPGVDVLTAAAGGSYALQSGTSMAAPFVTGSVALLNQWGIVEGNDPYLYGEKVKAYLIRGAKKLPAQEEVPDARAGWGALCVKNSIPT